MGSKALSLALTAIWGHLVIGSRCAPERRPVLLGTDMGAVLPRIIGCLGQHAAMARRPRFRNELSTLPSFVELVKVVSKMTRPMATNELAAAAGLEGDPRGVLGALWALELNGRVHATRGARGMYVWHPGERSGERPQKLPDLAPYEALQRTLREHGTTPIATDPLIRSAGLEPPPPRKTPASVRAQVLGALKALLAIGLVACTKYDAQAMAWHWATATASFDFYEFEDPLPLDALIHDAEGNSVGLAGDLVSAGFSLRKTRRGTWRLDAGDSSDW
jgi:hypothetical protein